MYTLLCGVCSCWSRPSVESRVSWSGVCHVVVGPIVLGGSYEYHGSLSQQTNNGTRFYGNSWTAFYEENGRLSQGSFTTSQVRPVPDLLFVVFGFILYMFNFSVQVDKILPRDATSQHMLEMMGGAGFEHYIDGLSVEVKRCFLASICKYL